MFLALLSLIIVTRASLTINKYLEEFPGLVHFLYIDRTNHRVTAPSLDFNSEETVTLTKKKVIFNNSDTDKYKIIICTDLVDGEILP